MVDSQMLSLPLDGREGTHSHSSDGVAADQLPHGLPLVPAEVEPHVLKGPLLGAEGSGLGARERYEMINIHDKPLILQTPKTCVHEQSLMNN